MEDVSMTGEGLNATAADDMQVTVRTEGISGKRRSGRTTAKRTRKTSSSKEPLEKLPPLKCDRQYMNNTKLSRVLATRKDIDIAEDSFNLKINKNVVNLVNIWKDPNVTLSRNNLTQYDLAVMDAVYTIISQGPMVVTPETILKVMSGNTNQDITESKLKKVKESMMNLSFVRIKVDCTAEYNAYLAKNGKKPAKSWTYESYLLPISKTEVQYEANGKIVTAYKVLETPALYRYAEMNHQIISVPSSLLETQEVFSDTDEAILIKRYVIKRVGQIVSKNDMSSNKISYIWYDKTEDEERGLFPELGYKDDGSDYFRTKVKKRINNVVKGTLETLKQEGAITGYEEYRADGTDNPASPVVGYRVFFDRKTSVLIADHVDE